MADALRQAQGTKPTDVNAPVPGQEEKSELDAFLEELPTPTPVQGAPTPEPVPAPKQDPLEELISSSPEVPDFPVAEDSSFGPINTEFKRQLELAPVRIAAGIAGNPRDTKLTLENFLGKDNVKEFNGQFFIRRQGEKAFRELDPGTFEIVNDLFSDFYKEYIQGVFATGGAAAGSPLGLGGIAAGAGLGAAAGTAFVSGIEPDLGVVRAEKKGVLERTGEAAIEGVLFAAGEGAINMATKAVKRYRDAQKAKKLAKGQSMLGTKEVQETVRSIEDSAQILEDAGINMRVGENGKIILTPGQIAGGKQQFPEAKKLDEILSTEGPVRDLFKEQAQAHREAYEQVTGRISNMAGRPAEVVFSSTQAASKAAAEIEGNLLGEFRRKAIKDSKGAKFPLTASSSTKARQHLIENFKFKENPNGTLKLPEVEDLQKLFDLSKKRAEGLHEIFSNFKKAADRGNGNIRIDQMQSLVTDMQRYINAIPAKDGYQKKMVVRVKDALRDDWDDAIGETLERTDEGSFLNYLVARDNVSAIKGAQKTLNSLLRKNDVAAANFASQVFSKAQGKERAKQLRILLQNSDDPQLWDELVAHKFQQMAARHSDDSGKIDFRKFAKEFDELDRAEVLGEMLGKDEKNLMKEFLNIAEKTDAAFTFTARDLAEPKKRSKLVGAARNLLIFLGRVSFLAKTDRGEKAANAIIQSIGKDKAMAKWLSGEGLELIVKTVPKSQKGKIRKLAEGIIKRTAIAEGVNETLQPQPVPTPAPPQ